MSEHERTISVNVPAKDAFRYLSSVSNLPDFVPHLSEVSEDEDGHVVGMADLGNGRRSQVSGFFRADLANQMLNWESDGTPGYAGWLQVSAEGNDKAQIRVHISMRGAAEETPPAEPGLASDRMERMFDGVMQAVQDAIRKNVTPTRNAA